MPRYEKILLTVGYAATVIAVAVLFVVYSKGC